VSASLVSVVIPVFNRPTMIREAVASALDQADHSIDIEVLIVDDGSTDDTPQVVAELAAANPRVHAHFLDSNRGPAAARNLGVASSTGSWITFLDSDDLMPPNRVSQQLDVLAHNPEADAVMGLEHTEIAPGVEPPDLIARRPPASEVPHWCVMTILLRREVWDSLGGFDEELRHAEDIEWYSRLLRAGHRVLRESHVLLVRRITGDNLVYSSPSDTSMVRIIRRSIRPSDRHE
jgi:glycosyltransferase involved in cell wall biosynthesis